MAASLRDLLDRFSTTDLENRHALRGSPRRAVHSRSAELASVLHGLSSVLKAHFGSSYTADELSRLRLLLEFPAPDFLGALGKANDENTHSALIAFLLDPRKSPGTAPVALVRLAQLLPDSERWRSLIESAVAREDLSVRREVQTGRFWDEDKRAQDRLDIVISGHSFVLAIENKVWSREHDSQTHTYWDWLCGMPGLKAGIFLSPGGFRAESEHFVSVSYLRMAWCFLGEMPTRSAEEEVMLSAYLKAVFGYVLRHKATMILGSEQ